MKSRSRRRRPASTARVDPSPLRSPEDATETGLIIGMTGNLGTPWMGIAIKNLKDRRIATGGRKHPPAVGPAGRRPALVPESRHPRSCVIYADIPPRHMRIVVGQPSWSVIAERRRS